ncbi:MAG TPA: S8 family serine peptidase, partial [Thermoanaerobaculia bacterium]|nr:S8 family serine peptidase [Thermoanaerobaculia bacterium]
IRDSGAIMVGGGTGPPRVPVCTTNYGSRMDVQGWARLITSMGAGDLFGGNDANQAYTSMFSGTSGASPMVAGAAADIQGVLRAHNMAVLSPLAMRTLLRGTGTPQAADPHQVGPLPNLRAAIDQVIPTNDSPPVARLSVTCSGLFCQANASASTDDHPGLTFSFRWETGGTATPFSTSALASHTYNVPGVVYSITVTAKDSIGQTHTATVAALVGGTTPGDTVGLAPDSGQMVLRLFHETGVGQNLGVDISNTSGWAISGDWNGDGVDTLGRFDPATSIFSLRNSNTSGAPEITFSFEVAGALPANLVPIAGDWNGDGVDTVGLFDRAANKFHLRNINLGRSELTFSIVNQNGGRNSFLPIAGDWNGDGIDTVGLYQTSLSNFLLRNENSDGTADHEFVFGTFGLGLLPSAGDWDGDGWDSIGLWNPTTGEHLLRNLNSAGSPDHQFTFTLQTPNTIPLAGDWDGDF